MSEPPDLQETRAAYDAVAADYAELLSGALAAMPHDRAVLGLFAELVRTRGGGMVADLGCGPGRVTAHLAGLGLDVFGVDLSPAMVAVARERYPDLRFDEGTITDLDLPDGALAGVVAWYSVIHTPPERLPVVLAELHRVLRPGGELVMAFQAGEDEVVRHAEAYGHAVSYDSYRLSPERVAALLVQAGLAVHMRVLREPEGAYERTPQAYLLARREAPAHDGSIDLS